MKKLFTLAAALLLAAVISHAQSDEGYRAALKEMLEASGTEAVYQASVKQMLGMFRGMGEEMPDEIWLELEGELLKFSLEDLIDMLTPIYQRHLDQSDLEAMTAFYRTPLGEKVAEKTPLITQESMQVGQQWGMQIGMKIQQRLEEKGY